MEKNVIISWYHTLLAFCVVNAKGQGLAQSRHAKMADAD